MYFILVTLSLRVLLPENYPPLQIMCHVLSHKNVTHFQIHIFQKSLEDSKDLEELRNVKSESELLK